MARQATRLRARRPLPGAPISLACAVGGATAVTPDLPTYGRGRSSEVLCDLPYGPTSGNATRYLFTLLKPQRYGSSLAWCRSNSSIDGQDPINAAFVPPPKRSSDVRHTLTALPAIPQLGPLPGREQCPWHAIPFAHLQSGKIRRCCVDWLRPPPKADLEPRGPYLAKAGQRMRQLLSM